MTTRPLLCLVTDRRRLAAVVGRCEADAIPLVLAQLEGAVRGGVDLVQIRERDLEAGTLARLVRDAVRVAAGSPTRIVVNDRVDVAVAAGAQGVHLREASVTTGLVRRAWPAMTIGRSVHSTESLARAEGADYLIAGTLFPTASKPGSEYLGAEGLARIVRLAGDTPVLAIGGVTIEHLLLVVRSGAQGIAGIGAFIPDSDVEDVAEAVEESVKRVRFAFDTASTVS